MFPIAGQTAGPIWAEIFGDSQRVSGGCLRLKKNRNFNFQNFFQIFFFHGQRELVYNKNLT